MKFAVLVVLFLLGVSLFIAGIALVYPPAALMFAGVVCVAVALYVEVGDA